MSKLRLGLALTGSYCSFGKLDAVLPLLAERFDMIPLFSERAREDSRFGPGDGWLSRLEAVCGRDAVTTIREAEPLGPANAIDVLAVVPCTGNTLGKLSHGITDTVVTMAAKGHLRNGKPLLLGISTNDGLGASAENIGRLLNRKNVYFVPFGQDDPLNKPASLSLDYGQIIPAAEAAWEGRQLQPLLLRL
ncbi:MAG: dipicolinate synthase subunit B [Oscillospiraceae bacterium]|nr:dipicolinate synthase subunit B [Oscillospiraceae bacterium]